VIVSGVAENQHLLTQYGHCRVVVDPLPTDVLNELGKVRTDGRHTDADPSLRYPD
jgi:hypothetical protein